MSLESKISNYRSWESKFLHTDSTTLIVGNHWHVYLYNISSHCIGIVSSSFWAAATGPSWIVIICDQFISNSYCWLSSKSSWLPPCCFSCFAVYRHLLSVYNQHGLFFHLFSVKESCSMLTSFSNFFSFFFQVTQTVVHLKLSKPQKNRKKVKWTEETVDNENMGKKKSKCKLGIF